MIVCVPQVHVTMSSHSIPACTSPENTFSASDAVYFGIVNGLDTHHVVPGQRLVEGDLAIQYGVGRNSVREALQRLAAEGVIEIVRHKGAVVSSLSMSETLDVLEVAERLTGLLARTAARAVGQGASIQPLENALHRLEKAANTTKPEDFIHARRYFYRVLLDLGASRELRRMFRAIHMPIVHAQHRLGSLQQLRLRDYRAIGKAVLAGSESAADAAGIKHVRNVREAILKQSGLTT